MWDSLIERDGIFILNGDTSWRPTKWNFTGTDLEVLFVEEFNDVDRPKPLKSLKCNPFYFSVMDSWYEPKEDHEKLYNFKNGPNLKEALLASKRENRNLHLFRFSHYDYSMRVGCYGEPEIKDVEVN